VVSSGSYLRYELNVTDDNAGPGPIVVVSIGKLELIGCPR
jgi:hypothetical protein